MRTETFTQNAEQSKVVLLWLAIHIDADVESVEWVATPQWDLRKANLNLAAEFFYLLVFNTVSPTKADNFVTWDRTALVTRLDIDFARILIAEIHKWSFKTSITYPFSCLIL